MRMNNPKELISQLEKKLATCMLADQFPLRRRLNQAKTLLSQNKPIEKSLVEIGHKITHSSNRYESRLAKLPQPEYPESLPVSGKKEVIAEAIKQHQVVIVCGETGSGKTTQLPKICLELGRGVAGLIGHTQPRRIAARTVATRIAEELDSSLGDIVGYKVRFNEKSSEASYIKLMTDGILLAETQGDPFLNAYDTIIIDEAHERSLNIDFLLGYLKQLLPKRPDLKIIVTSATIDADRFGNHFSTTTADGKLKPAPIIEVSGRTFPVEIRYRPLGQAGFRAKEIADADNAQFDLDDDTIFGITRKVKTEARWLEEDDEEEAIEEAILDAADDLLRQGDGDILVFLPGEREIRDVAEHLRKYQGRSAKLKHIEVLPLFARLSIADQQKIFKSHSSRRIVLATNVAETSLTVPGIKYVIDAGLARVNRYSTRAKVEQLQIEKISQAAAKQRAGRCGRVSNGICVRLYSEDDFNGRPAYTDPEILRSSLASVILRMAALRLGDVNEFPFIEAPSSRLITDGYQLLQELGAVTEARHITEIGKQLAKLPLDPRVGRMILAAKREGCLKEMLIIASVLSIQDPRERPMDKREAADNAHAKFLGEGSDFMTYLKIWDWFEQAFGQKKSNKDLLNQCHSHFLSFLRLKEWRELHHQIKEMIDDMDFKLNEKPGDYQSIHKALLAGLLGNIGYKDGESDTYAGARGIRFHVAPGSCLKKTRPKWVIAAELVDTSKLYARCVAKIEPDWIEPLARGLTQSHYSDPRWDRKMGMVNAWERVSLYGLTIIPKRRVHYGPINPQEAREIFIREALANGEFNTNASFFTANERLIAEIEELEHKARRQDVLVDEHQLFAFYDQKLPADIVNAASFEHWRKTAEATNPKLLYLTRDDLMRHGADAITAVQFPESMLLDGVEIPLKYRFEPSHPLDGVTATIPLALLNQLNHTQTEWLVPGMLREKLTYLVKALPKAFRRVCVPVPEFVTGFLENHEVGKAPITQIMAAYILKKTSLKVPLEDWGDIPDHLLMNFSVVDDAGNELAMGRNWHNLKKQLSSAAQLTFRNTSPDIEKTGLKQWDFGDLPASLNFEREGLKVVGFPALEDNIDSVSVKLFDTEQEALANLRKGVCRLMCFELKQQMKQLEKNLPNFNQYALALRNVITPEALKEDMLAAIADRAFIGEDDLPRTNDDFMKLKARARTRLPAVSQAIARHVQAIGAEYQLLTVQQAKMPATINRLKKDCEQQIALMVYPGFVSEVPWENMQHIPRYLKAMRLRIEKQPSNPDRDGKHAASVGAIWQRWHDKVSALKQANLAVAKEIMDFRWLIEELRVSLFAQELKTPFPISTKRLDKVWQEISH
jgi:ATP-dependent helicase HrpA